MKRKIRLNFHEVELILQLEEKKKEEEEDEEEEEKNWQDELPT